MQINSYVSDRRKRQGKRRKYFWSIAAFLAVYFVFLGIVLFIVRLPAFQAKQITINGASAVSDADIMDLLQASVIRSGASLTAPNSGLKAMLGFKNMLIWPDALSSATIAVIPQLAGLTIAKDYFSHSITVTVTERQPFAVWCEMPEDNCFWFDNTGYIFESALDTQGGAIAVIHDYSKDKVSIGDKVLPDEFMPELISVLNVLKESGVGVTDISLPDISLQQINVTTVNGPILYFSLRYPADEDLAVLRSLIAQPDFGTLQYVDFTVQNRAYYK